jgi:hypothetical protein
MSSRLLVVFLAVVLPSGCTLPELRELGCGDSVLSAGEDCDGRYVMPGGICGDVGTRNECLYVCSDGVSCPEGWGCGLDGRCYQPQPELDVVTSGELLPGGISTVTDVDGDGVGDLAGSDGLRLSVSFGGDTDAFSSGFFLGLPNQTGDPWFGDVDGDGPADVVIPQERALLAFTGAPTREYVSRLFSRAREPVRAATGTTLEADGDILSETLVLTENDAGSTMRLLGVTCGALIPLPDGLQVSDLTSPLYATGSTYEKGVPRADLDGDGISEFALAFTGRRKLYLYTSDGSTDGDPATCTRPTAYQKAPEITLPEELGLADSEVLFVDVDGDANLDILLPLGQPYPDVPLDFDFLNPVSSVWVAYGAGDGTFGTALEELPGLSPVATTSVGGPLAGGDLDGDGLADYVMPSGIFLAVPPAGDAFVSVAGPRASTWTEAAVIDVNADGFLDVITIGSGRGIDWFVNAGAVALPGRFNRYIVDTESNASHLSTGDFNGDFSIDVAVVEVDRTSSQDQLTVVLGVGAGLPGQAQPNGHLGKTTWFMEAAVLQDLSRADGAEIDGISDLVILSSADPFDELAPATQEARFYDMLGSTTQKLLSPLYVFEPADESAGPRAVRAAVAGNFAGSAAGSGQRSLAVLSVPALPSGEPDAEVDASLALFTGTPDGDLQRAAVSAEVIEQLSIYHPNCVHWLAGDVGGAAGAPGLDELIAVEASLGCNGGGDGTALSLLVIDLSSPSSGPAGLVQRLALAPEYVEITAARLADLDLDGAQDLVLVAVLTPDAQAPGATAPIAEVLILWNDGACAAGPFCLESSTKLPAHDLREVQDGSAPWPSPHDVVPMQLDSDEHLELAVLYGRFYLPDQGRTAVTAFGSSAEAPRDYQRIIMDSSGDGVEDRSVMLDLGSRFVARMAAGDVNGDGLDDLVLDEILATSVYMQVPAEPLGTTMARTGASEENLP